MIAIVSLFNPLIAQLTADTTITVTMVAGGTVTGSVLLGTWKVANFVRDVRDEVAGLRKEIRQSWSRMDQIIWSTELERRNRNLPLNVPAATDSLNGK